MNNKKYIIIILALTLVFRLYLAFQNPYFDSDQAYFSARLIETIVETKTPFLYDPLSYGGREIIYPQFFHYVMSFFSFIPSFTTIIPEIFITSLTLIAYLIAKRITKDEIASLITALLVAFSPALIRTTSNQISVLSLAIPVMYIMFHALLDLRKKHHLLVFVICSFILPLIHPISFLFSLSLIFYLILSVSESVKMDSLTKEATLFSFFLIFLINFILYKKAFLLYGLNIIWQNLPSQLILSHFQTPNLIDSIYLIGILPLILGSFGLFYGLFKHKNKGVILLTSPVVVIILLMLLKLINLELGILFLSISLTIMSSIAISRIMNFIGITKWYKHKNYFIAISIILILVLVVVPSFFSKTTIITPIEVNALEYLERNSQEDSTVLAPVSQGHLISYFANRKNVADSNFLLAPNAGQRLKDINLAYTTPLQSKALEIFHKYSIDYIFISREAKKTYGTRIPIYLQNENCFKQRQSTIYEIVC